MTKTYTFKYGSGTVDVPLDGVNVLGVLHGHQVQPIEDIRQALYQVLDHPNGLDPLKDEILPTDTVAVIVSDMSRFWMRQDLVIPHLIDYLTEICLVPVTQITIVIANGTHIGGDEKDLRTLVTDRVYDEVCVVNHDCEDPSNIKIGETSYGTPVRLNPHVVNADRVIALGACTHHVMAGYGGGRKSILPGVAALESVRNNHAYALDPLALKSNHEIGNGKLEGNPLHLDMMEAAQMLPHLFVVNLVMNAEMKLARITAGHVETSWLEAVDAVNHIYNVDVPEKADVIVTSCGGYPKDMSLYQGTKTIDNVESGLKPGGTLIFIIEAREGGGPSEYFDWNQNWMDGTIETRLREAFTIPGYIFFLNCEQAMRYNILMYSAVDPALVAPMGIKAFHDMDQLLKEADLEGKTCYVIPNGSTVVPHVVEGGAS